MFRLQYFIAFAGIWALVNGVLHDVFVLLQRKPFDRDLIRLLLDGHILIFSGICYLICVQGIAEHLWLANMICMTMAIFLVGYCALIYKILPSIFTISINLTALVWLILEFDSV